LGVVVVELTHTPRRLRAALRLGRVRLSSLRLAAKFHELLIVRIAVETSGNDYLTRAHPG